MEVNEGIDLLTKQYCQFDWFDSVGLDKYKRYVVYVLTMSHEIMTTVQESLDGKQVLIAYAGSKVENMKKYHTVINTFSSALPVAPPVVKVEPPVETQDLIEEELISIDDLIAELDRLERLCGSHILQDIFFEVHDGRNAVTNLSAKFPEVRKELNTLYDEYGFDLIYEELDG